MSFGLDSVSKPSSGAELAIVLLLLLYLAYTRS